MTTKQLYRVTIQYDPDGRPQEGEVIHLLLNEKGERVGHERTSIRDDANKALADSISPVLLSQTKEIADLRTEKAAVTADLDDHKVQLAGKVNELTGTQAQLATTEAQLADTAAALEEARAALASKEAELAAAAQAAPAEEVVK